MLRTIHRFTAIPLFNLCTADLLNVGLALRIIYGPLDSTQLRKFIKENVRFLLRFTTMERTTFPFDAASSSPFSETSETVVGLMAHECIEDTGENIVLSLVGRVVGKPAHDGGLYNLKKGNYSWLETGVFHAPPPPFGHTTGKSLTHSRYRRH